MKSEIPEFSEENMPVTPPPMPPESRRKNIFDFVYRFPATTLIVLLFICVCELMVLGDTFNSRVIQGFIMAAVWTMAIDLTAERCPAVAAHKTTAEFSAILISAIIPLLQELLKTDWLDVAMIVITMAGWTLVFFQPRKRAGIEWDFTCGQINAYIMAGLVALLGCGIVGALTVSINTLLNFNPDRVFMAMLAIVVPATFTIIFLNFASRDDHLSGTVKRFYSGVGLYLLLPLLGIYTLIFLIYLLKLCVLAQIPKGTIGLSVIGWIALALSVQWSLMPVRRKHIRFLSLVTDRIIPWVALALLTLLAVALGYRIGQYGITARRAYVILFTLWGYAIFGRMLLKGIRHPAAVAYSLAGVMLLFSVFPYANLIQLCQREEADEQMMNAIDRRYDPEDDVVVEEETAPLPQQKPDTRNIYLASAYDAAMSIPADVQLVRNFRYAPEVIFDADKPVTIDVDRFTADLPVDSLLALDDELPLKPITLPCTNCKGAYFIVNRVSMKEIYGINGNAGSVLVNSVEGLLFTQKVYIHKKHK